LFAARKELQNFDVIHMHEYRTLQNVMVHYYAKKYGVPYILQAHGSLPQNTPKQKLKKLFDYLWGHKLIRDASKLIALTETEVEQYKGMGVNEDKIEIVPNGVDLAEFDDLPPRGNFRKRYGLDDSQRIILYLGRIHQTKGVDLLLKAFAGLLHHASDARLIIAGPDNGYLKTLKHLMWEMKIEEGVIYTGPLYDRDKLEAYVDADVFVTPSFSGFPMTFMEACACGVPIITTEKGDQLDWLNGQVGLVVPYDEKRLEEALRLMLSDDRMRQELNENGKSLVRERFNWTKIAEKVESIYSSCFSSKL
jgi:glycosyltransferase involved in cell wall biosynthesis